MRIVRVTAIWCMSCLAMKRVWRKVFGDDVEIVDLDYDQDKEAVERYQVGSTLPVLIIYQDGEEITRIIGEKSKKQMQKIFEELNEKD